MDDDSELSHNNFGRLGSEFVIEHKTLKTRKLCLALFLSGLGSAYVNLHMNNIYHLWVLSAILFTLLLVKLSRKVHREVLLILPSLGLQVKTEYVFGQRCTKFIDLSHIQDVIINEAISMQSVISYLAVLIKDESSGKLDKLYPLFLHSNQGLEVLTTVYRCTQEKLFPQPPESQ